jgi:predicted ABC-type ATPase
MDLLIQILQKADEAYLWDNSKERHEFVASYKKGTILFEKSTVPEWVYAYIIDKVGH